MSSQEWVLRIEAPRRERSTLILSGDEVAAIGAAGTGPLAIPDAGLEDAHGRFVTQAGALRYEPEDGEALQVGEGRPPYALEAGDEVLLGRVRVTVLGAPLASTEAAALDLAEDGWRILELGAPCPAGWRRVEALREAGPTRELWTHAAPLSAPAGASEPQPGLRPLLELGRAGGSSWVAWPAVSGASLWQQLARHGPLPGGLALERTRAMLEHALAAEAAGRPRPALDIDAASLTARGELRLCAASRAALLGAPEAPLARELGAALFAMLTATRPDSEGPLRLREHLPWLDLQLRELVTWLTSAPAPSDPDELRNELRSAQRRLSWTAAR